MAEQKERKVHIDGNEYNYDDLPDDVKHQLLNINFTDQEIDRVSRQLGIAKTAKTAYIQALKSAMATFEAKD